MMSPRESTNKLHENNYNIISLAFIKLNCLLFIKHFHSSLVFRSNVFLPHLSVKIPQAFPLYFIDGVVIATQCTATFLRFIVLSRI